MKNFGERKILEMLKKADKALTYGEVLANSMNIDPYFASLAVNLYIPKHPTSQFGPSTLDLFFDDPQQEAVSVYSCYVTHILPRIIDLEKNGNINHLRTNGKKQYQTHANFVSDNNQKIRKRIGEELERKKLIQPTLISIAKGIVDEISKTYPVNFQSAFLIGSSSDKNGRPFIYYGDSDEIRSVSDLDLTIFASDYMGVSEKLKSEFDEISRRRKIVLNPIVKSSRNSGLDAGMMKNGIPIFV